MPGAEGTHANVLMDVAVLGNTNMVIVFLESLSIILTP